MVLQLDGAGVARNLYRQSAQFPSQPPILLRFLSGGGRRPSFVSIGKNRFAKLRELSSQSSQHGARAGVVGFGRHGNGVVDPLKQIARHDDAHPARLPPASPFPWMITRTARKNPAGLGLVPLDPACNTDLPVAVEKRNRTHLPEIKPNRIVRLIQGFDFGEIVGVFKAAVVRPVLGQRNVKGQFLDFGIDQLRWLLRTAQTLARGSREQADRQPQICPSATDLVPESRRIDSLYPKSSEVLSTSV